MTRPNGLPRLLTLAEVATLAGRSRRSLYTDVALGRLQVTKLGRSVRITEQDYLDYLARGRQPMDPQGRS